MLPSGNQISGLNVILFSVIETLKRKLQDSLGTCGVFIYLSAVVSGECFSMSKTSTVHTLNYLVSIVFRGLLGSEESARPWGLGKLEKGRTHLEVESAQLLLALLVLLVALLGIFGEFLHIRLNL